MKTFRRRQIASVIFLTSLLLTTYYVSAASATNSSIAGVTQGQTEQWAVTASSGVTTTWYSETFAPVGNFSLPVGSIISLTLTSVLNGNFYANISVGGLVLTNVSMSEISFNLLLGWYPFNSGLVCPTNWNVQAQNATSNGFTVEESLLGPSQTITFTHLNGTVGTQLTYDKSTGLLETGYGSFGQFLIEVALIHLTSGEATIYIGTAIVAVAIIVAAGWYGTARGRKTSRQG
jgi:hypothetical protein